MSFCVICVILCHLHLSHGCLSSLEFSFQYKMSVFLKIMWPKNQIEIFQFCDVSLSGSGKNTFFEADEGALAWMADVDADRPEDSTRKVSRLPKPPQSSALLGSPTDGLKQSQRCESLQCKNLTSTS